MNESERLYQKMYAYVTRTTSTWDMATLRGAHPQVAEAMHDLITSGALGVTTCGSRCCDGRRSAIGRRSNE